MKLHVRDFSSMLRAKRFIKVVCPACKSCCGGTCHAAIDTPVRSAPKKLFKRAISEVEQTKQVLTNFRKRRLDDSNSLINASVPRPHQESSPRPLPQRIPPAIRATFKSSMAPVASVGVTLSPPGCCAPGGGSPAQQASSPPPAAERPGAVVDAGEPGNEPIERDDVVERDHGGYEYDSDGAGWGAGGEERDWSGGVEGGACAGAAAPAAAFGPEPIVELVQVERGCADSVHGDSDMESGDEERGTVTLLADDEHDLSGLEVVDEDGAQQDVVNTDFDDIPPELRASLLQERLPRWSCPRESVTERPDDRQFVEPVVSWYNTDYLPVCNAAKHYFSSTLSKALQFADAHCTDSFQHFDRVTRCEDAVCKQVRDNYRQASGSLMYDKLGRRVAIKKAELTSLDTDVLTFSPMQHASKYSLAKPAGQLHEQSRLGRLTTGLVTKGSDHLAEVRPVTSIAKTLDQLTT
jgi:hypothetical protein